MYASERYTQRTLYGETFREVEFRYTCETLAPLGYTIVFIVVSYNNVIH